MPSAQQEQHRGSAGREDASNTTSGSVPSTLQSPSPEPPKQKALLLTVIVLAISLLELVFSIMNAVRKEAFRLSGFEDYVYAASSTMEVVGLLFGLACYFCFEEGGAHLGLPLTLMSTGVVEDDGESRKIGFTGTVVQAAGIFVLLVVRLCLAIDWFFWVVVAFGVLCCLCRNCICCLFVTSTDSSLGGGVLIPPALTREEREIPKWAYLTLPFSPVVVEFLESYFLLKDFSLDRLVLLATDVLVILPGIAWLVVQVLNLFKPSASSTS